MRFVEILDAHRIRYETDGRYSRPGWVQFQCPHCSGGKDPDKLYAGFCLSYRYVNCWRCGKHSIADTLYAACRVEWSEAKRLAGLIDRATAVAERPRASRVVLPDHLGDMQTAHREYLRGRGFDPDEIERLWGVRGIGIAIELPWRLWIPINRFGELVSWTTRSIDPDNPMRYISASPEQETFNHRTLLYGADYVRHECIVVEGPTDVWNVGPGAVATLGTGFTPAQVATLVKRFAVRYVCYDPEPAAQRRARALCDSLMAFPGETYNVVLESGNDPGSASKSEVRELREAVFGVAA